MKLKSAVGALTSSHWNQMRMAEAIGKAMINKNRSAECQQLHCLTMNQNGMMAIQHQVLEPAAVSGGNTAVVGDGKPNFVDFIMMKLEKFGKDM